MKIGIVFDLEHLLELDVDNFQLSELVNYIDVGLFVPSEIPHASINQFSDVHIISDLSEVAGYSEQVLFVSKVNHDSNNVITIRLTSSLHISNLLSLIRSEFIQLMLSSHTGSEFRQQILLRFKPVLDALEVRRETYVFGAQRLGMYIATQLKTLGINVLGFIDNDDSKHGEYLDGVIVKSLESINDKSIPVVIGTTKYAHSIKCQLENRGISKIATYPVLSLMNENLFPHEIPYVDLHDDVAINKPEYTRLYLELGDQRSREVFDAIMMYRFTYESDYIIKICDKESEHYFDRDLIELREDEVFVDAGGFDGDTSLNLFGRHPNIKKIVLFEPDHVLMAKAKIRLKECPNIEFVEAGVYSKDGEVRFSMTGSFNGAVDSNGELAIPVRKIDSVLREPATFIKMDIEGAESEALIGAQSQIRTNKPKLAIATYHKGPDIWMLPEQIKELNPDYTIYLRHYSETGLETVIFAL